MNDRRGLHFLTGLATLWMMWRLYASGWLDQLVYAAMPVESGPGAIIVGLIIEAVITVGMLAVLVASGLWDLAMVSGRMIGDALGVARQYVVDLRPQSAPVVPPETAAASEPQSSPITQQTQPQATTGDPVKDAIVVLSQQQVQIAERLQGVIDRLDRPATESPAPQPAKQEPPK